MIYENLLKTAIELMDYTKNPEWQIHHNGHLFGLKFPYRKNNLNPEYYVKAFPEDRNICAVKDIGRKWFKNQSLIMPESKKEFITWEN